MKRLLPAALLFAMLPFQSATAETITYGYDALGRLVSSTVSGGPASGATTGISYDAAGNRTLYSISGRTAANISSSPTGKRLEFAEKSVQKRPMASFPG